MFQYPWKDRYAGCEFTLGKGENLQHYKYPYWLEYTFDANVTISCGNDQGTMTCTNFIIKQYVDGPDFDDGIISFTNPHCENLPKVGTPRGKSKLSMKTNYLVPVITVLNQISLKYLLLSYFRATSYQRHQ